MRSVFTPFALCAVAMTLAMPSAADQLMVNGKARTYAIAQPATANGPQPTIIVLHGLKGTGASIAQSTKLGTLAPQQGFVAVFPDGQNQQWNFFLPGKELDFYVKAMKAIGGIPDDGAFLKSLIADLVQRGVADPQRVYIVGESNGSLLALRMLCTDANLFAGAALLATAMPETLAGDCHPPRPIPVLMIKGTKDEVLPYAGGLVQPQETFRVWSNDKLVGFFQQLDNDTGPPQSSVLPRKVPNFVQIDQWATCPGIPLTVYRVVDGPHIAPADLNEGQVALDFFSSPALKSQCVAALQNPAAGAGTPGAGPGSGPANNPSGQGAGPNGQGIPPNGQGTGPNGSNPNSQTNGPGTGSGPNGTDPNAPGGQPGTSPGSDTANVVPPPDNPGSDTANVVPPPDNPGSDTANVVPPNNPSSPTTTASGPGYTPLPQLPPVTLNWPTPNPPAPQPMCGPWNHCCMANNPQPPPPPNCVPTPANKCCGRTNSASNTNPTGPGTTNGSATPGKTNGGTTNGGTTNGGTTIASATPTGTPPVTGDSKSARLCVGEGADQKCRQSTRTCTTDGKCTQTTWYCDTGKCSPTPPPGFPAIPDPLAASPPPQSQMLVLRPAEPVAPPPSGMLKLLPQPLPPALPTNTASTGVCNKCTPCPPTPPTTSAATREPPPKKKEVEKKPPPRTYSNNSNNAANAANAAANAAAAAAAASAVLGIVGAFRHGGGPGGGGGHC